MPWHPAQQYMQKIDDWGKDATDRIRATTSGDKSSSVSDRFKVATSGKGVTAVGARWDKEKAARQNHQQQQQQGEYPDEDGSAGSSTPSLPPRRLAAPDQRPASGPPPQRTGATVSSSSSRPPPPPARNSSGAPPPLPRGSRPPLPARTSTSGSAGIYSSGASPPAPPPRLPPRMNNEAGVSNPPPAYEASVQDTAVAVSGMSLGAAASPSRRAPPPRPAGGKPAPPPIPGNRPQPPSVPARKPSYGVNAASAAASGGPSQGAARSPPPQPPRAAVAGGVPSPFRSAAPAVSTSSSFVPPALTASRHPSTEPCKALSAATFFCYPSHYPEWNSSPPWFHSSEPNNLPPPPIMEGRRDAATKRSMQQRANDRTLIGALHFDDLSTLWYRINYDVTAPTSYEVKVAYCDAPSAWTETAQPGLLQASAEGYGELIARKAESWEGQVVGDGECWTLAHQSLVQVNAEQRYGPDLKLLESVGRTHGHLIYHASIDEATGQKGGIWRGGDFGNIRRGDILEWATSSFKMSNGGTARLGSPESGMPDHTAIIIDVQQGGGIGGGGGTRRDAPSTTLPQDQSPLSPSSLPSGASITVLEQSAGKPVHRNTYHLDDSHGSKWVSGACWVFRPVGEVALLQGTVEAQWGAEVNRRGWEALN